MKRIKRLIMLIICAALFTGCAIKYETTMEITKEGKVNFSMVQAFDKELLKNLMSLGGSQEEISDEALKQYLKESLDTPEEGEEKSDIQLYREKGFNAEEYFEGEFLGYKLFTTIEDINKVSSDKDVMFNFLNIEELPSIQEAKMFKKVDDQYVAHLVFDPTATVAGDAGEGEADSSGQMDQYLNQISQIYTFSLTLPKKSISNNATTVSEDGKTLTWNLSATEKTDIKFTFELADSTFNIVDEGVKDDIPLLWLYIILAIAVVGIIVIVVIMINKDKKDDEETVEEETKTPIVSAHEQIITPIETPVVTPIIPIEQLEEPVVPAVEPQELLVQPETPQVETNDNNEYGTMTLEEPPINPDVEITVEDAAIEIEEPVMHTDEQTPVLEPTVEPEVPKVTISPAPTENVESEVQEEPIRNKFCTNCGTKVIPGHKFCVNCGEKLK